jgi:Protein of unknown function (DUF2924)
MPRVKVGPALPDVSTLDIEIAHLRDLDVALLQARSRNMFRRRPSPHLPRHLLFRVLAYRLQAELLGDLDVESRRLLDGAGPPEDAGKRAVDLNRPTAELRRALCWPANGTADRTITDLAVAQGGGNLLKEPAAVGRRQRLGGGHDGAQLAIGKANRGHRGGISASASAAVKVGRSYDTSEICRRRGLYYQQGANGPGLTICGKNVL